MAITQISRIQHRRGISTELPQLSSAEFGWSVDTRQLYIGNGTIEEGAPTIGNTEILTEYSDLLSIAQAYTFKGLLAGYTAQTGPSVASPVSRSLQNKLDDFVNVRDFGAIGDGNTDDTAAINRVLAQIYCINITQPLVRRTIYFPAGNYKITGDVLKVPTYATLQGDGADRTFITQVDATQDCVIKLADSKQQIDTMIATNGATKPKLISINGMSFVNNTDNDVLWVRSSEDITFNDVKFSGSLTDVSTTGTSKNCVWISTDGAMRTNNIQFNGCFFEKQTYGVSASDSQITNVIFQNTKFNTLYAGINLADGSSSGQEPAAVKVISSEFDGIYASAINGRTSPGIFSAFNYYGDVGNTLLGAGFPTSPVIVYGGSDCCSIGDYFVRSDSDDLVSSRISFTNEKVFVALPHVGLDIGNRRMGAGSAIALVDNTASPLSTNITLGNTAPGATVSYTIVRGSLSRTGVIKTSQFNGALAYTDEYSETGDTGVTLYVNNSANTSTIQYTTTSTGAAASMKYSVDWHKFNI